MPRGRRRALLGLPDVRTGERVCAVVVVSPGGVLALRGSPRALEAEGMARQMSDDSRSSMSCLATRWAEVVRRKLRQRSGSCKLIRY